MRRVARARAGDDNHQSWLAFSGFTRVDLSSLQRRRPSPVQYVIYPIAGTAACCARAASGHTAAPPSRMTKSRRRIPDTRASPLAVGPPHAQPMAGDADVAPTAESSPAPENFFSKTVSVRKATPFWGAETIFGQVFGRGGMSEIPKTKVPPRGPSASQMTFEGTDLGLGAARLCSLLRPSQTHRSLA